MERKKNSLTLDPFIVHVTCMAHIFTFLFFPSSSALSLYVVLIEEEKKQTANASCVFGSGRDQERGGQCIHLPLFYLETLSSAIVLATALRKETGVTLACSLERRTGREMDGKGTVAHRDGNPFIFF